MRSAEVILAEINALPPLYVRTNEHQIFVGAVPVQLFSWKENPVVAAALDRLESELELAE